jgi:hypothetical protein
MQSAHDNSYSVMAWDNPLSHWEIGSWDTPIIPPLPVSLKRKKLNRHTMASNPTPDDPDVLRALADRMADGCNQFEVILGIKQNMEAVMRAAINGLSLAETDLGLKKQATANAYVVLQTADDAGHVLLTSCKLRLATKYGQRWSADWEPTGFPDQSTTVPRTQDKRFTLLNALKNYFTVKPADEAADVGVTAAACDAQWSVISTARQGVANAESAQTTSFNARGAAVETLRKRVRGLIDELTLLLAADDARWENFGLNMPANPSTPEPVTSMTASALGSGRIEVGYPYATRATSYRIENFILGVSDDWAGVKIVKDLETILTGYTAGQTVKLRVVARNEGGDAQPCPEVTVVVT